MTGLGKTGLSIGLLEEVARMWENEVGDWHQGSDCVR